MGTVFQARHVSLGHDVAVKVIRAGGTWRETVPRTLPTRGRSDGANQTSRSGRDSCLGGRTATIHTSSCNMSRGRPSMRKSTRRCRRRPAPPSPRKILPAADSERFSIEATQLISRLAAAISAVHRNGIAHRDVKPENILVRPDDGQPVLIDFGLAHLEDEAPGLTRTGQVAGTPYYIAPERLAPERFSVDSSRPPFAGDVWAVGVTLYRVLTGRYPFDAPTKDAVAFSIVHDELVSPRQVNRRVPHDLDLVCRKALQKDPRRRYASADRPRD